MPGESVAECVNLIRSYVHLLAVYPERQEYKDGLTANLVNLSKIASGQHKTLLAFELNALVVVIRNVS